MWVAPIWAFITGVLTLAASYAKRRDMLLNVSWPLLEAILIYNILRRPFSLLGFLLPC